MKHWLLANVSDLGKKESLVSVIKIFRSNKIVIKLMKDRIYQVAVLKYQSNVNIFNRMDQQYCLAVELEFENKSANN